MTLFADIQAQINSTSSTILAAQNRISQLNTSLNEIWQGLDAIRALKSQFDSDVNGFLFWRNDDTQWHGVKQSKAVEDCWNCYKEIGWQRSTLDQFEKELLQSERQYEDQLNDANKLYWDNTNFMSMLQNSLANAFQELNDSF